MPVDVCELITEELKAMNVVHVDRFAPFFLASIGAHIVNIRNKLMKKGQYVGPFLKHGGTAVDLRLPIMFIAPPGAGKTFWMEKFLIGPDAFLPGSGVGCETKGPMTEAAFVGTFSMLAGAPIKVTGAAEKNSVNIVGIDEYSVIVVSMKSEHSRALDPQMLQALDSGRVKKDTALGQIKYTTYMSLWSGTQPARFDLGAGMARRFIFLYFIPTKKEWDAIKQARRNAWMGACYVPTRVDTIRKEIRSIKERINNELKNIQVDPLLYEWYNHLNLLAWEERLYDSIILGYKVMKGQFDDTLVLDITPETKNLIMQEIKFRRMIGRGQSYSEIIQVLRDNSGSMEETDLKDQMIRYGRDWKTTTGMLGDLLRAHGAKRDKVSGNIVLAKGLMKESLRYD